MGYPHTLQALIARRAADEQRLALAGLRRVALPGVQAGQPVGLEGCA